MALKGAIEEYRAVAGQLDPIDLDGWGDLKLCGDRTSAVGAGRR
ncbi:hypothetical protein ACIRPR_01470 [Streptomyces griseoflavus]